ncbi:MAG TPA: cupin-like domain-containing protein [Fimbriiglobus sp.]
MSAVAHEPQSAQPTAAKAVTPRLPVERRKATDLPYEEYLQDYVVKNRPLVIEGAVSQWPALEKWTPEFFKERFGQKMVNVERGMKMPFADFIDAVNASCEERPGPYMYRLFIGPQMPELLPDVLPQNEYAFPRRLASPLMPRQWRRPDGYLKLLIGGVGGKFPNMHYDGENVHATITEIYGEKEFLMVSPEDTPYVYSYGGQISQITNFVNPDYEKFPLFEKAKLYSTILRPGEMVFVPSRWWHTARVVSTSISVCQNMLDQSNWRGFVKYVGNPKPGLRGRAKSVAVQTFLTSLGAVISTLEHAPGHTPETTGKKPGRLARWAPKNRAEADDPSKWKMHKWFVRGGD